MRRVLTAVAKSIGCAERLPTWITRPSATADEQLASALEELARVEADGRKRGAASAPSSPSPLQATADSLKARPPAETRPAAVSRLAPDILADLAKSDADIEASLPGTRLGELGRILYVGDGEVKDVCRATRLWVMGARKGDVYCMHQIALGLVDGVGTIPKNREMAEQALQELVLKRNSGLAAFGLAGLLLRNRLEAVGANFDPSLPDIAKIPASEKMHADCIRAVAALQSAAAANVPPSWLNLAHCYLHGIGTSQDQAVGEKWLRHAASRGDMLAIVELAARLSKAAYTTAPSLLLSRTARSEPSEPADPLQTLGTAQARWESLRLWRQAAEGGHPVAMHNFAAALMEGYAGWLDAPRPVMRGGNVQMPALGDADPAAAVIWFRRAASAGFLRSMINTASLLEKGAGGVPVDTASARAWYAKAASHLGRVLGRAEADLTELRANGEVAADNISVAEARRASLQKMHRALEARMARLSMGSDLVDEAMDAELRLDFRTVEARDGAYKVLSDTSTGSLTAAGLLRFLHNAQKPSA